MSAIAGVIYGQSGGGTSAPPDPDNTIGLMSEALAHRGDSDPVHVCMSHAAFTGRQFNEGIFETDIYDSSLYTLVFDGKLSNLSELAKRLGISPDSSVAKTLLEMYLLEGKSLFNDLQGSFAVVIHVKESGLVFQFRDLFSGRPLFVAVQNGTLWFASEIKGILADPEFKRSVNVSVLPQQLTYGITMGSETLFKDVYKLAPGYYFECRPDDIPECKILFVPSRKTKRDLPVAQYSAKIWDLLGEGISQFIDKERLHSIRTGLFLSGGVDSSLVALKQKELGLSHPVAISCGYSDENVDRFDETKVAEENARICSMDFRKIVTGSEDDLLGSMKNIVQQMEEPTRFLISIPVERAMRKYKGDFSCLVTGMYADVFFGSEEQYDSPTQEYIKKSPKWLVQLIRASLPVLGKIPTLRGYAAKFKRGDVHSQREYTLATQTFNSDLRGLVKDADTYNYVPHLQQLFDQEPNLPVEDEWSFMGLTMYIFCWDEVFERLGSYAGVDVIHPFKTASMYELSEEMPYKGKISKDFTKPYVRELAADKFSHEFAYAKKQIFASPGVIWLEKSKPLRDFALTLDKPDARIHQYLNSDAIKSIVTDYQGSTGKLNRDLSNLVYTLIGLELWLREFIPE
ncbi:MAG: asparagine synthase-related protein [Halioglobus sp.]